MTLLGGKALLHVLLSPYIRFWPVAKPTSRFRPLPNPLPVLCPAFLTHRSFAHARSVRGTRPPTTDPHPQPLPLWPRPEPRHMRRGDPGKEGRNEHLCVGLRVAEPGSKGAVTGHRQYARPLVLLLTAGLRLIRVFLLLGMAMDASNGSVVWRDVGDRGAGWRPTQ